MKKKGFIAVIVVCVVIIGCCTGGLSLYLLHSNQKQKEESAETIARLEENIEKANQKADDAALEAKKAKEKSEDSKKKVKEYKEKLEQLETNEEEVSATPIPTEVPTSTPEPIPEETIGVTTIPGTNIEIGIAECARDHAGVFSCDSGYLMNILYGDNYDDDMYFSCQDTVPGAHGYNKVEGYGKWENDVFTYTGTRYSNDEAVGSCNGTVTHVPGTNNLQWTDSMGGTNIGPFYSVPS
jgi:hypothetical protein